jgi:hypothetical protein
LIGCDPKIRYVPTDAARLGLIVSGTLQKIQYMYDASRSQSCWVIGASRTTLPTRLSSIFPDRG